MPRVCEEAIGQFGDEALMEVAGQVKERLGRVLESQG